MLSSFVRRIALCGVLMAGMPVVVSGQTNYYATNGTEYAIVGSLPGDQVHPDVALTASGGFVVWQDNITDGDGWGVSAMQLNGTLAGSGSSFRVNVQGAGDQENPRVALLKGGGAVFVWQGGQKGFQHIYARFLTPTNTWMTTDDVPVSSGSVSNVTTYTTNVTITIVTNSVSHHITYTTNTTTTIITNTSEVAASFQITPAVATLTNGNVVMVWASFDEAGSSSLLDVYGRIFSPAGVPVTGEFLINQFTSYNQRTPAVAALANGGFVVAWVSERSIGAPNPSTFETPGQMSYPGVDIYARLYDGSGNAQGNEFPVNTDSNPCADPAVAAGPDGGFMMTWDARDMTSPLGNGLDVYACSFNSVGTVIGTVLRVNTYLYGDQYAPRISSLETDYLIVWTSLAQDGSREGVYGQFLRGNGSVIGNEFCVNTTTVNSQIQPAVASDGVSQFLAIWSSFTGLPYGVDLYAQRYINSQQPLEPLPAPFVYAPFVLSNNVYQPQLVVSWPPATGLSVSNYEVYVDGASTPTVVTTSNVWTMTTAVSSTHSFRVDYVTTDGRQSPISPSASGTTWSGLNWGGIPYEWMAEFFGGYYGGTYHTNGWPSPSQPPPNSPPGSPTLLQLFLSGGIPYEPTTWLQTALANTPQGLFLSWNTQPGFTYQVQVTTNFTSWTDLGAPRFAADTTDSIFVGKSSAGYYRVLLLRQ